MLTSSSDVPRFPSKKDDDGHQGLRGILSVLSNRDALRVFELASKGVIVSKSTLQKINLPKVQYYRKVKQLCDLRLIIKDDSEEGGYRLTPLGEVVYQNQVVTINRIAADNNIMEFLSKFMLKNKSKNETLQSALKQITQELIEKSDPGLANLRQLRVFERAEDYDNAIQRLISSAKKELYLVTTRLDLRTINALLSVAKSGVKTKMLYYDLKGFYSESTFDPLNDSIATKVKFRAAPDLLTAQSGGSVGTVSAPYGFAVSDDFGTAIEIPDIQESGSFLVGFGLESEELANKLILYFSRLEKEKEEGSSKNRDPFLD